ncbi:segregation and condensation protein A [Thermodesulfobacteriota bacterium]
MMRGSYKIKLENIFEGPMDLLVYLIRKNEVNIYDIPIALITVQFLEYIEWMKSLNIDFVGDFILMAATLTKIKSKMLLPVHESEDPEEDPRSEITRPLQDYLQMKSAAEHLAERDLLGEHTFIRKPDKGDYLNDTEGVFIKVGLFELIDAFKRILDNVSPDNRMDFSADSISVKDKISYIVDILEEKKSVTFDELFFETTRKEDVIVTFLALLEMVKLCLVRVVQHMQTGIIRLFYL